MSSINPAAGPGAVSQTEEHPISTEVLQVPYDNVIQKQDELRAEAERVGGLNAGVDEGVQALSGLSRILTDHPDGFNYHDLTPEEQAVADAGFDFIAEYGGGIDPESGEPLPPEGIPDHNGDGVITGDDVREHYSTQTGDISGHKLNDFVDDLDRSVQSFSSFASDELQNLQFIQGEFSALIEAVTSFIRAYMNALETAANNARS